TSVVKPLAHGISHFFEPLVSQRADWRRDARRLARRYQCDRFLAVPVHRVRARTFHEPEHEELAARRGNLGFQQRPLGDYGASQPAKPLLPFEESPSTFWILGRVSGRGWLRH